MDIKFSQRLRELLGGGDVRPFSRKCGVTEATVRNYLKGADPRLPMVIKIAAACGVRVGWLAAGELPKELKREVLEDEESLDLIAAVGRIMDEKSLDQLQAFEEYKTRWDINARKILKLPMREKVVNWAATPGHHPALDGLDLWLFEVAKTNRLRFSDFSSELKEAIPDYGEWVKKRTGENLQAGEPQANYNNSR